MIKIEQQPSISNRCRIVTNNTISNAQAKDFICACPDTTSNIKRPRKEQLIKPETKFRFPGLPAISR